MQSTEDRTSKSVHSWPLEHRSESERETDFPNVSRELVESRGHSKMHIVRTFNDFKTRWSTTCCWSFLLAYHCVCISCLLPHPLKRHPVSWLMFPIKSDSSENASLTVNPTSKVQYWSNARQLYAWSLGSICGRRWFNFNDKRITNTISIENIPDPVC
jgi:hypothetical protein